MNQPQLVIKTSPPTWLKILVIILIGLSIFFRFTNLGQKIYCGDENWTSVAISGYTVAELQQEAADSKGTISITTFSKYQHINPERGVADTVNYLITSDPQHPPLYYVLVRLWAQVFGDSPTGVRSLSAIISILIFPSIYWLCLELFDSAIVGWVAMALIAVSPLQLYFAQEARQYSLWMLELIVSSAALLRAIRKENKTNWAIYSLTLALGLYSHLFTILIMIAHGIYIIIHQRFRFHKTLINYLLATIVAFLIFLPWLNVIINHLHTAISLTSGYAIKWINNPFELISIFLIRLTRTFFDINLSLSLGLSSSLELEGPVIYTISELIFSLILITYLVYLFFRNSLNKPVILVFLLGLIPGMLLIASDLFTGGIRSIQIRYQLPLCISLEILVAYVVAFYIFQEKTWMQKISQLMIVVLLIGGLISDVSFFQTSNWWIQSSSTLIKETSEFIKKLDKPLLVTNNSPINLGAILALSNYLPKLLLLPRADDDMLPIKQDDNQIVFMYNNSSLFHQIEQDKQYDLKVIRVLNPPPGGLWEFAKIE
ncbi:glycosyltransferase family 39 protein [Calothrix sp. FACHB-1219]|uniref:glycosyltransferase family 39 protein n=1 Tax=unclassified Calothrix TaxID=2619626 RepID=UPI0016856E1D|nr:MULTISPECIES: glycosyltransferase family 39 protein [unclassified Calothrix]MBD2202772.1 glycosyltransferase family 39 protein [Calothrix sp. FACHB-168]MBD2218925.1 glycosyltransferase family 39 protein [Calothrix sp. FACHB-1219]